MKQFFAAVILMGSLQAMALADVTEGTYTGLTVGGEKCYVQIKENTISAGIKEFGKPWKAISIIRQETTENGEASLFKFSNRVYGYKLTLHASLNPQKEIVSATIKMGFIFMTTKSCIEMTKKD